MQAVEQRKKRRWQQRRWLAWVGAAFVLIAIAGAALVEWGIWQLQPRMRQRVVETLSARFHSPVELDQLSLSFDKGVIVTGSGLRILYLAGPSKPDARPNAPPMVTVRRFEFRTGWRELLKPTTRVLAVKVEGLTLNIPPKPAGEQGTDNPARRVLPKISLAVDRIECTNAKVVIENSVPGKIPLEFDIDRLVLTDIGTKKALGYEAVLKNPKPVGDVSAKGSFGPWQGDNPRDTPLDGNYQFTHANLASIHGLGGILASEGRFGGTLGGIAVDGAADVPDFRLDVSDHALPLHTEFHAIVDGTTGNTHLDAVQARIGRSDVSASGSVIHAAGGKGHTIDLKLEMKHGRLEDMQTLSMKGNPTLMRGGLLWKAHLVVPPGPESVSRKIALTGIFAVQDGFLNNANMQARLDALSERTQGKPKLANAQDAAVVGSALSGSFSQANAVVTLTGLTYQLPGAQLKMDGQLHLVGSTYDLHGTVRTQATASQMTTGWKSLLMKPFDGLLKKNGAGLELPIRVTGTSSTYDLRLDFPHNTHAPGATDPEIPAIH